MKQKSIFHIVGTCFLFLFLSLSYLVKYQPVLLSEFDQSITIFIRTPYPDWNTYQLSITKMGNSSTVILLFLIVSFLLWRKKKRPELIWLAVNFIIIAGIINPLIKLFVMRIRPSLVYLVVEYSYSFPSGHAATSMILYGSLLFILPTLIQTNSFRLLLQFFLAVIIITVGISRVYLGVHFPSDILGGYLLSLSWLFFTYPIYNNQKEKWQSKIRDN
ncbi:phosphatase PAP2 family protein [Enterococcus ratti]|uniref:Type 2 phosphatidic acid phosphatase family protein n=1 Tax=Enterococcus ratti TaxID=150033 RepID=A0A1L8WAB5_9ENTE|nr:phosphatase PAP2 family protein [Enterococcus ratti]OJG77991.1 type 2 phosphatidic acid phosphatase family protein [Enterococcus ratti]